MQYHKSYWTYDWYDTSGIPPGITGYKIVEVIEQKEEGKQAVGRERTESLISYFANETFQNATINDPEFEDFTLAKDEAYEWNDVLGQKANVCKNSL